VARRYPVQVKCFAGIKLVRGLFALSVFAVFSCVVAGCDRLSAGTADAPFVRCPKLDAPKAREWKVGSVGLKTHDRDLELTGLTPPFAIAAFAGPAPGKGLTPADLATVRGASPKLVIVLGGLGDTEADVLATSRALATLTVPVLVVQGGRDRPAFVSAALEGLETENVIDASALWRVRIGQDVLVPLSGASHGRYAIDETACGHALDDVKALAAGLGARPQKERRFLVAWEAPGQGGAFAVARDSRGVDTGDADLAELARRIEAPGGLFAWPNVRAGEPAAQGGATRIASGQAAADFQLVVPRIAGPALALSSGGALPPSAALLTLDEAGLRLDSLLPTPPVATVLH